MASLKAKSRKKNTRWLKPIPKHETKPGWKFQPGFLFHIRSQRKCYGKEEALCLGHKRLEVGADLFQGGYMKIHHVPRLKVGHLDTTCQVLRQT